MPELPEVEVVKRSLEKKIKNLTIKKVNIRNNKLRYKVNKNIVNKLNEKRLLSIKRISKYLLFNFNKNISMIAHLGMTGKFFVIDKDNLRHRTSFYYILKKKEKKHNHLIFEFSKKTKLIYNDVRRFGFVKIVNTKNILQDQHIKMLGPDALSINFNKYYFKNYLKNKKKSIKNLLMDQKFVSGLGNIYVNEILYYSKISPKKNINKINEKAIDLIIKNTKKILKNSIKKGGSSIKNFSNADGKTGDFQQKFKVYAREGKNCLRLSCEGTIKKTTISNRSSFCCNICQK